MLQLARRALEAVVDVSEPTLYSPDPNVLRNLYSSLIGLVGIFLGSKTSLKIWRALQAYDNLTKGKDTRIAAAPVLTPKGRKVTILCGVLASIWSEDKVLARIVFGALTAYIVSACLTQPLIDCVANLKVTRPVKQKTNGYIVRSVSTNRMRAVFATVAALSITVYQAIVPSSGIFCIMILGFVYQFVSRPNPIDKGRLSVRAMVIMLSVVMIIMILFAAFFVFAIVGRELSDNAPRNTNSGMSDEDSMGINNVNVHILNGLTETLIALVLRYEYSLIDLPDQLNASTRSILSDVECLLADEKKEEVSPESESVPNPSLRIAITVLNTPNLCAPLFALCLNTLAIVHLPAFVLTSGMSSYGTKLLNENGTSPASIAALVLAEMPPQIWSTIFVPLVVILATYLRKDGNQLWRYSEQWVIEEKESDKAKVDVENTITSPPAAVEGATVKEGKLVDITA